MLFPNHFDQTTNVEVPPCFIICVPLSNCHFMTNYSEIHCHMSMMVSIAAGQWIQHIWIYVKNSQRNYIAEPIGREEFFLYIQIIKFLCLQPGRRSLDICVWMYWRVFIKLTNMLQLLNLKHTCNSLFSRDFLSGMKNTGVWVHTVRVLNSFFLVLWFGGCRSLQAIRGVYCLMMAGQASLYDSSEERETKEWVGVCFSCVCDGWLIFWPEGAEMSVMHTWDLRSSRLCWKLHYSTALFIFFTWMIHRQNLPLSLHFRVKICVV